MVSESALQAREDEMRQVAMGTHAPDRPSVAHHNSYMAGSTQTCLQHAPQVRTLSTSIVEGE